jgi:hypothetical protein
MSNIKLIAKQCKALLAAAGCPASEGMGWQQHQWHWHRQTLSVSHITTTQSKPQCGLNVVTTSHAVLGQHFQAGRQWQWRIFYLVDSHTVQSTSGGSRMPSLGGHGRVATRLLFKAPCGT